jgi:hypothetical protein
MTIEQKKIKEFREKFTYSGRNQADQLDVIFKSCVYPNDIESFILQTIKETREEVCKELIQEIKSTPYKGQGIGCGLEDVKITDRYE